MPTQPPKGVAVKKTDLEPGDIVTIKMPSYTKERRVIYEGTISCVYPKYIILSTGKHAKYNVTISISDLHIGQAIVLKHQKPGGSIANDTDRVS